MAEQESAKKAKFKKAIIYCRAATRKEAERQRNLAEAKAKQLNATVEAVFVDVIPARRISLWQKLIRTLRGNRPKKAEARKGWRKAVKYYTTHKLDYVITQEPTRFSRVGKEYYKIVEDIRENNAQVVFSELSEIEAKSWLVLQDKLVSIFKEQ